MHISATPTNHQYKKSMFFVSNLRGPRARFSPLGEEQAGGGGKERGRGREHCLERKDKSKRFVCPGGNTIIKPNMRAKREGSKTGKKTTLREEEDEDGWFEKTTTKRTTRLIRGTNERKKKTAITTPTIYQKQQQTSSQKNGALCSMVLESSEEERGKSGRNE